MILTKHWQRRRTEAASELHDDEEEEKEHGPCSAVGKLPFCMAHWQIFLKSALRQQNLLGPAWVIMMLVGQSLKYRFCS